ncbi:MAG: metal-dependent phosphohydrolase [Spirochaetaceae bacterium]|nr:metal-dependent phosphohydrolase [Spirochaetaceae bacterium]
MAEKISGVSLKKVIAENSGYARILLAEATPVLCVNTTTKKNRVMNFKALFDNDNRFWLKAGPWEYYLESGEYAKLRARVAPPPAANTGAPAAKKEPQEKPAEEASGNSGFGKEYAAIAAMTAPERTSRVEEAKNRLDALAAAKTKDPGVVTEALVETTQEAMLANRATLLEAMHVMDEDAKRRTQSLVDSTHEMVKSSTQLISENIFGDELMATLVEKSNGTVIQHMTRVFLNGTAFLTYYNNLVSTSSLINKMRISFEKKYKKYYRGLLPHLHAEDITMEKVFYKGMRAVSEQEFYNWATGFLIHDIGKASAVEYHEGEAAYDRDIVMDHVKVGYTAVMNKTNYPREAGLITGYHHEYYGHAAGYGYFRSYLEQYKKLKPDTNQEACIAYELEPMMDYQAMSFFPAKILEIIDVYDSITDPNRKYRKALTPEEALAMLKEEFIEKHFKIDVILYDIFADFVRQKLEKRR